MAIQFVGYVQGTKLGAASGDTTLSLTSLTGGIASSAAENDLVVAMFGTGSSADRTLAITDGSTAYTLIGSEMYANASNNDTNFRMCYKFMGATPDTTTTFGPTGNANDAGAMACMVFRGVHLTTPLDGVTPVESSATNTVLFNSSAITPASSGAWVVVAAAGGHGTVATGTFSSSDLSNFITQMSDDSYDVSTGMGTYAWSSGAFDPAAWTFSDSDGTQYSNAGIAIALKPAASSQKRSPSGGVAYGGHIY